MRHNDQRPVQRQITEAATPEVEVAAVVARSSAENAVVQGAIAPVDGLGLAAAEGLAWNIVGVAAPEPLALRVQLRRRGPGGEPAIPTAVGGQAMAPEQRARFEAAMGHDFSEVRIHVGPSAAGSAEDLGAHAFAMGPHIFFGAGEYAPGTPEGDRLLAHELTHVIQHDQGALAGARGVSSPSDPTELEAYSNEVRVVAALQAIDSAGPALEEAALGQTGGQMAAGPDGHDLMALFELEGRLPEAVRGRFEVALGLAGPVVEGTSVAMAELWAHASDLGADAFLEGSAGGGSEAVMRSEDGTFDVEVDGPWPGPLFLDDQVCEAESNEARIEGTDGLRDGESEVEEGESAAKSAAATAGQAAAGAHQARSDAAEAVSAEAQAAGDAAGAMFAEMMSSASSGSSPSGGSPGPEALDPAALAASFLDKRRTPDEATPEAVLAILSRAWEDSIALVEEVVAQSHAGDGATDDAARKQIQRLAAAQRAAALLIGDAQLQARGIEAREAEIFAAGSVPVELGTTPSEAALEECQRLAAVKARWETVQEYLPHFEGYAVLAAQGLIAGQEEAPALEAMFAAGPASEGPAPPLQAQGEAAVAGMKAQAAVDVAQASARLEAAAESSEEGLLSDEVVESELDHVEDVKDHARQNAEALGFSGEDQAEEADDEGFLGWLAAAMGQLAALEDHMLLGILLSMAQAEGAARAAITEVSAACNAAMNGNGTDEKGLLVALSAIEGPAMALAVRFHYGISRDPGLLETVQEEVKWSEDTKRSAVAYLEGRRVDGAAAALSAATGWTVPDLELANLVVAALDESQRQDLIADPEAQETVANHGRTTRMAAISGLAPLVVDVNLYELGALEARMDRDLDRAQSENKAGAYHLQDALHGHGPNPFARGPDFEALQEVLRDSDDPQATAAAFEALEGLSLDDALLIESNVIEPLRRAVLLGDAHSTGLDRLELASLSARARGDEAAADADALASAGNLDDPGLVRLFKSTDGDAAMSLLESPEMKSQDWLTRSHAHQERADLQEHLSGRLDGQSTDEFLRESFASDSYRLREGQDPLADNHRAEVITAMMATGEAPSDDLILLAVNNVHGDGALTTQAIHQAIEEGPGSIERLTAALQSQGLTMTDVYLAAKADKEWAGGQATAQAIDQLLFQEDGEADVFSLHLRVESVANGLSRQHELTLELWGADYVALLEAQWAEFSALYEDWTWWDTRTGQPRDPESPSWKRYQELAEQILLNRKQAGSLANEATDQIIQVVEVTLTLATALASLPLTPIAAGILASASALAQFTVKYALKGVDSDNQIDFAIELANLVNTALVDLVLPDPLSWAALRQAWQEGRVADVQQAFVMAGHSVGSAVLSEVAEADLRDGVDPTGLMTAIGLTVLQAEVVRFVGTDAGDWEDLAPLGATETHRKTAHYLQRAAFFLANNVEADDTTPGATLLSAAYDEVLEDLPGAMADE